MSKKIEKAFDKNPEEYSEDFPYQYNTVTDLNQNGRLELIISSGIIGSGLFTYSQIYEVSEDGTQMKNYTQNIDFIGDIVDGIDTAYYNKKIEKEYFKGLKKKKVKIFWNKFKKKSKEESVEELLKETYKEFQLN